MRSEAFLTASLLIQTCLGAPFSGKRFWGPRLKDPKEQSKIKVSLQGGSLQRERAPWEQTGKRRGRKRPALAGDAGGSSGLAAHLCGDTKTCLVELPTHSQRPCLPSDSVTHGTATNLCRSADSLPLPECSVHLELPCSGDSCPWA